MAICTCTDRFISFATITDIIRKEPRPLRSFNEHSAVVVVFATFIVFHTQPTLTYVGTSDHHTPHRGLASVVRGLVHI